MDLHVATIFLAGKIKTRYYHIKRDTSRITKLKIGRTQEAPAQIKKAGLNLWMPRLYICINAPRMNRDRIIRRFQTTGATEIKTGTMVVRHV